MMQSQFQKDATWMRGNTHCHTTRSDGAVTIERRIEMYEEGGYDFLAITDHNRTYDASSYDSKMTLVGASVSLPARVMAGTAAAVDDCPALSTAVIV